jgi:hypothetical protein
MIGRNERMYNPYGWIWIKFPEEEGGIMETKNILTRVLAIVGTVLAWLPVLVPVLLAIMAFFARGRFLFDYLMPAELFLVALAGSGLLLWASIRAHSRTRFVVWGLIIAILMFVGVQWFAALTGLDTGETEPVGWIWGLALAMLVVHSLGIILVGVGGALLLSDLFKKRLSPA